MPARTVSRTGQVALGKDLLVHMGVRPGDKIHVEMMGDGLIRLEAEKPMTHPTGKISDIFGLLKREGGPSLSIDEINEISGPPGEI